MDTPLIELIYASAATAQLTDDDLPTILATARAKNEAVGVTGILLFTGGSFIQVLEGPEDAVQATFERIGRDQRHDRVLMLRRCEIDERRFGEWSMGYPALRAARERELSGFTDFLRTGQVRAAQDNAHAVLTLLERFRSGRYRQTA